MNRKTNGILCGILFVTLFLSGCKSSHIIENKGDMVETDEQGLIVFDEEETDQILEEPAEDEEKKPLTVGVSFVDRKDYQHSEMALIKKDILAHGYTIKGMGAVANLEEQRTQIRTMIQSGVDALIIRPIDIYGLSDVLDMALEKSIPVFSYRELIMNSNAITYLCTFNYRTIGQNAADKMIQDFGLEKKSENESGITLELLMGDSQDMNSLFFFNGLMEHLLPYIESGDVTIPSEKDSFEKASVVKDGKISRSLLNERLDGLKVNGKYPDVICCENDEICRYVITRLEKDGLRPGSEEWPYITGLGCEKESINDIAEGKQKYSFFLDERLLAEECINHLEKYLNDSELEVSDYGTYDNGIRIVGTMLSQVQIIDGDNYQLLIDNGYFASDEME